MHTLRFVLTFVQTIETMRIYNYDDDDNDDDDQSHLTRVTRIIAIELL
jgi:hypothetical protein